MLNLVNGPGCYNPTKCLTPCLSPFANPSCPWSWSKKLDMEKFTTTQPTNESTIAQTNAGKGEINLTEALKALADSGAIAIIYPDQKTNKHVSDLIEKIKDHPNYTAADIFSYNFEDEEVEYDNSTCLNTDPEVCELYDCNDCPVFNDLDEHDQSDSTMALLVDMFCCLQKEMINMLSLLRDLVDQKKSDEETLQTVPGQVGTFGYSPAKSPTPINVRVKEKKDE